jgi:Mrp family chromosome partitioning ATPase
VSLLQDILDILPDGTTLPLKQRHDPSLTQIIEQIKIVRPPLSYVTPDNPQLNTPIIILSAPGAVGKSTLAKYLAFLQYLRQNRQVQRMGF